MPGMSPDVAIGFRDKPIMKQRLFGADLRVPRFARVRTAREAFEAAYAIGYPVCVKPVAGAGSADTYRVGDDAELRAVLGAVERHPRSTSRSTSRARSSPTTPSASTASRCSRASPSTSRSRWRAATTSGSRRPQVVFRDPYQPALMPGIELGRKVLKALGMTTGFTHMEWYKKPNGEAVFGEIAARSPGGKLVDQMNFANDFDLYRETAARSAGRASRPSRSAATTSPRCSSAPLGQGKIRRIEGLERHQAAPGAQPGRHRPAADRPPAAATGSRPCCPTAS